MEASRDEDAVLLRTEGNVRRLNTAVHAAYPAQLSAIMGFDDVAQTASELRHGRVSPRDLLTSVVRFNAQCSPFLDPDGRSASLLISEMCEGYDLDVLEVIDDIE
jgi:hypothetical protein